MVATHTIEKNEIIKVNKLLYIATKPCFIKNNPLLNYISQGSVAMRFRCGRIFNDSFVTRLLMSLTVKEFVKIGQHLPKLCAIKYRVVFMKHGVYCSSV